MKTTHKTKKPEVDSDVTFHGDPLIGRWFHSWNNGRWTEQGKIEWQGRVLARIEEHTYLVQLFSWLDGEKTDQVIVELNDMFAWTFYSSSEQMAFAYTYRYTPRRDQFERDQKEVEPSGG